MGSYEIEISREDLYEMVWDRPMSQLSKELGMSDVGIRKICRRHNIPTPPQGYHLIADVMRKKSMVVSLPPSKSGQSKPFTFRKEPENVKRGTSCPKNGGIC